MILAAKVISRMERRACLVLFLGLSLLVVGCGQSGPPRYRLSGKVTWGGKPVPAGSVTFMPDTTKGSSGPATSALIKDGAFDTSGGAGHVGGPHIVKIIGLDGKAVPDAPSGLPMFPSFQLNIDLPKENGTKDLEVPGDWVLPKTKYVPEPTA